MNNRHLEHLFAEYGMVLVLLLLGLLFSALTFGEQSPEGATAGRALAKEILKQKEKPTGVLAIGRNSDADELFVTELRDQLKDSGIPVNTVTGQPSDALDSLKELHATGVPISVFACNEATANWAIFENLESRFPNFAGATIIAPATSHFPAFLKRDNLLNIANQIAVIAILAIGMTMVILTAGIDLSVGSLVALSAVVSTWFIREFAGGESAGPFGMILACLAAILVCALVGAFSGLMVTSFSIPPFITTLAMMLVASGLAFIIAGGQSIYQIPDSFTWLGRGADLGGVPNAVVLMALLYIAAQVLMKRTLLGRYIYALGGNREAAHLSGVPVERVLLITYTFCGGLAGLGGVILASQLKSGSPTYGAMYELYVIAAVVVGGTSLFGGRGKIFGTLIGAFIIAVIQNGMNLTGVESYTQKVVLGGVILAAVLLDQMKTRYFVRG